MAEMVPLQSSHIVAAGWDEKTGTLTVAFKGGRSYEWLGVTQGDFESLIGANSPGQYLRYDIEARYGKGMPAL